MLLAFKKLFIIKNRILHNAVSGFFEEEENDEELWFQGP